MVLMSRMIMMTILLGILLSLITLFLSLIFMMTVFILPLFLKHHRLPVLIMIIIIIMVVVARTVASRDQVVGPLELAEHDGIRLLMIRLRSRHVAVLEDLIRVGPICSWEHTIDLQPVLLHEHELNDVVLFYLVFAWSPLLGPAVRVGDQAVVVVAAAAVGEEPEDPGEGEPVRQTDRVPVLKVAKIDLSDTCRGCRKQLLRGLGPRGVILCGAVWGIV